MEIKITRRSAILSFGATRWTHEFYFALLYGGTPSIFMALFGVNGDPGEPLRYGRIGSRSRGRWHFTRLGHLSPEGR